MACSFTVEELIFNNSTESSPMYLNIAELIIQSSPYIFKYIGELSSISN